MRERIQRNKQKSRQKNKNTYKKNYTIQKICFGIGMVVSVSLSSCGTVSYAAEAKPLVESRSVKDEMEGIRSRGRIVYEEIDAEKSVVYDGTDIREIYNYLLQQKEVVIQKLFQLGTKFIQTKNGWEYHRYPEDVSESIPNATDISWEILIKAVNDSQTVPSDLPVREPKISLQIEGIAEYTDCYRTATADNISEGKAAWQEGVLLLGTGMDNKRAYEKGKKDAANGDYRPEMKPIYRTTGKEIVIKHKHIGSATEIEGQSGCYHNYTTIDVKQTSCGATLQKTEAIWYPNELEEGGGSWHGGYFTCPWHGGIYENAGICTSTSSQENTIWHHDITCGKTDVIYAVLKIKGQDENYMDGKITLQAELVGQKGFVNLQLSETEKLVWSNEKGEVIGYGTAIEVSEKGIYTCSVAATNQDVSTLSGKTEVVVSGLIF